MAVGEDQLVVTGADAVTILIAAATSFVTYKDVSGDPAARVDAARRAAAKPFAVALFGCPPPRAPAALPARRDRAVRSDRRTCRPPSASKPSMERTTRPSRPRLPVRALPPHLFVAAGTQPANLQGIWNDKMNPMWDSKYTTNINTQMNYWPAEVGNLSECAEPLFTMIKELTDQGSEVAREHYGARGWVHHQNTDLWRVAAPMDGPSWGTFTTGGAWLCAHLWEHYLFTGDKAFLRAYYPVLKGAAEFFLDFLVPSTRKHGWLVTSPRPRRRTSRPCPASWRSSTRSRRL